MVRHTAQRIFLGLFCFFGLISDCLSQIIVTPDVDELCRSAPAQTHRVTMVYIDLSAIKSGENEWGNTILNKLELAPRERVTVLGVNPSTFDISEVFDSCFPMLTKSEIDDLQQHRGWWDRLFKLDPESQQRENLQTFHARLGNALDQILEGARKFEIGHRRNILGAIAIDKNRYRDQNTYYRIIVYTNGIILDDFGNAVDELHITEILNKKYPASFSGAEVFLFGITGADRGTSLQSKQKIFSSFFLGNWAHIQSFSQSLPQQTSELWPPLINLSGTFEGGGTSGSTKLKFAEAKPMPTDAWITFLVGGNSLYVPVQGTYQCEQDACSLTGTATESVPAMATAPYFRKGDKLKLTGKKNQGLGGILSSEGKEVFQDGNGEAQYKLNFLKP